MRSIWWLPRTEIHGHPGVSFLRSSFLKCCSNIAKTKSDHDVDSTIARLHLYPLPWAITTLIADLPQKELTFHHISLNIMKREERGERDPAETQKMSVFNYYCSTHKLGCFSWNDIHETLEGSNARHSRQSSSIGHWHSLDKAQKNFFIRDVSLFFFGYFLKIEHIAWYKTTQSDAFPVFSSTWIAGTSSECTSRSLLNL